MIIDYTVFPFYNFLTEIEKEEFKKSVSFKMIHKGTKIKSYGNNNFGPFLIVDGRARLYLHNEKFRDIFLYTLTSGDLCMITQSKTLLYVLFESELEIETNSFVIQINPIFFKHVIDNNSKVRAHVYETLTERLSLFVENIQTVLFDPIQTRVARFILEEYNRLGLKEFKKNQGEIAKNISSSKEVVNRALKKLSSDGIINYEKGKIKIVNDDKIKDILNY